MKCKLRVTDVSTGMYVAELDRPWLESPFLFQGFTVESRRELSQLRETCQYVFVDLERSRSDLQSRIRRQAVLDRGKPSQTVQEEAPPEHRFKAIKRELARALDIREKTRQYVDVLMDDARLGKHVSVQGVKTVVTELLDTILINPSASLWLIQLREKDHHTAQHAINTAVIGMIFARHEGLDRDAIESVGMGGLLHDIGKVKVPRSVLHREGPLSEDELKLMRTHPEQGLRLLEQSGGVPEPVKRIVVQHHERLDGSGYPRSLVDRQIDSLALLVGLVDLYDAMCGDWPGNPALSPHRALAKLRREEEKGFGRERIERFIKCMGVYPIGTVVRLSNGAKGMVVSHNRTSRLKPVLMMVEDPRGTPYRKRPLVDLAGPRGSSGAEWQIESALDPAEFGEDKIRTITTTETIL
ncbi:putative nucleotidyltransferase with HDIG domain [Natronospira proteinivora]|uniref:Nucleotidyltransferase with HDIG domain n=1 Tax=Natronospira proteinivora TaxID=1807133 RepID=A0ABT1G6W4_9GAMM|nr:HD-GYP domain-containing protein [Natronospira proteinivora]MCP1727025.1 putative nucleotidyltransferase with HDIG domain [Natronospira proteinivora]